MGSWYFLTLSQATVFSVVCSLLMVVPPLLISYRTQGFWLKTATYREQPNIHFTHTLVGKQISQMDLRLKNVYM